MIGKYEGKPDKSTIFIPAPEGYYVYDCPGKNEYKLIGFEITNERDVTDNVIKWNAEILPVVAYANDQFSIFEYEDFTV